MHKNWETVLACASWCWSTSGLWTKFGSWINSREVGYMWKMKLWPKYYPFTYFPSTESPFQIPLSHSEALFLPLFMALLQRSNDLSLIWWQFQKFSHPSVTTSQGKLRMAQTPLQSGPKWSLSQMHSAPLAGSTEVLENETSRRPSVSTQIYDVHGIIWGFLISPKKLDTPLSSSIISFERNPYFLSWMACEVKTIKIHCIV